MKSDIPYIIKINKKFMSEKQFSEITKQFKESGIKGIYYNNVDVDFKCMPAMHEYAVLDKKHIYCKKCGNIVRV